MKTVYIFVVFLFVFFFSACKSNNPVTSGDDPNPPSWVNLSVKIDSLPQVGKTGSIQFNFVVVGKNGNLPLAYATQDTMNYIRISFLPEPGRKSFTTVSGDSTWEGRVSYLDTILLKTQFTPQQTSNTYFTNSGGNREFDWAVSILVGYYHITNENILVNEFIGSLEPPFNNPEYAILYINTKTKDVYIEYLASKP